MLNRILDFSDAPARLSVRYDNLCVEPEGQAEVSMPLSDIAVLVVSHPQIRYTHAVLAGLAEAGGVFVTCNRDRLPIGMLMPLEGHYVQVERFAAQAAAPLPLKKRLWQQIVQAKILSQSRLLAELHGSDFGLAALAPAVRSGDPSNIEARAARRYWQLLFSDKEFRRDRDAEDQNRLLNYGYAVLRALVARALCGAGLHPSLGIHHHNKYSTYCLADDLMESLRPVVDRIAVELAGQFSSGAELERAAKRAVIEALLGRYKLAGEQRTLFDISARMATSLADCFLGTSKKLALPEV